MLFVTRASMRRLAPVELLLKQTAVGDAGAAPSVLAGAVVRVLIDKVGWAGGVGVARWDGRWRSGCWHVCWCSALEGLLGQHPQRSAPSPTPMPPMPARIPH